LHINPLNVIFFARGWIEADIALRVGRVPTSEIV
jgi:hypothetical protein